MQDRPRLKRNLVVATVDGDKLFLIDDERHFLLEGRAFAALAPLLDGGHDVASLLESVKLPLPEVLSALTRLDRLGHLAEGAGNGDALADAYWDALGVDPLAASARLAARPAALTVLADASVAAAIGPALAAAGLMLGDVADAAIDLVVCDDYLDPRLLERNRRQLAAGRPWLAARVHGPTLWLGPFMRPGGGRGGAFGGARGDGLAERGGGSGAAASAGGEEDASGNACIECLAQRLRGNRQVERFLDRRAGAPVRDRAAARAALPATLQTAAGLLATELQTILAGGRSRLADSLLTLDLRTFETVRHPVVRLPQCPACGDPGLVGKRPPRVRLRPAPKRFTADGGHRVCPPEETLVRLTRHISPLTGAVSSVTRQTTTDNGVAYSYSSGHNFALMNESMYFLRKNMRGRSGGKGRTDHQARVGAVCEAIERFNGVWRGDEPRRRAAFAELDGATVIHPERLLAFSDRQYAERDTWNPRQQSGYHLVPERLDQTRPVDWTPCWSLTHDRERLVPSAYCYFGHPDMADHYFCASDANGCAAGNTLEEAILQGLMELAERDSVALWWYNRARRPVVDLDSFDEPYVELVRAHYASLGREMWVLDITTDLGIPAFAAVSRCVDRPVEDILLAFGAHVDPGMALLRALTELNQFLPAVSEVRPDGTTNYWMDDPDAIGWWRTATVASAPYVVPDPAQAPRRRGDFTSFAVEDIADDVRGCVGRLASLGLETIVLDQTRPDIDLAVCKVMVPGLRHFWRRVGPGRLYDVPVALGWLAQARREEDLNPIGIFF
jgi:bacteriocin biosynthesis cyclodehydratase domain-containing protein